MYAKVRINKPVAIPDIEGATIPDAVARIGNLKLNEDGTLNIAMHYYLSEDDSGEPIAWKTYENASVPALAGLEAAIMAWVKQQPEFDQATDL